MRNMNALRKRFMHDALIAVESPVVLIVAVLLPSGSVETITNTSGLAEKIDYYIENYDDDFFLKKNGEIQIIGYMLV